MDEEWEDMGDDIPAFTDKDIGRKVKLRCLCCKSSQNVFIESSRTKFVTTDGRWDWIANMPLPLCRICAKDYHEYWDEKWENWYYSQIPE